MIGTDGSTSKTRLASEAVNPDRRLGPTSPHRSIVATPPREPCAGEAAPWVQYSAPGMFRMRVPASLSQALAFSARASSPWCQYCIWPGTESARMSGMIPPHPMDRFALEIHRDIAAGTTNANLDVG